VAPFHWMPSEVRLVATAVTVPDGTAFSSVTASSMRGFSALFFRSSTAACTSSYFCRYRRSTHATRTRRPKPKQRAATPFTRLISVSASIGNTVREALSPLVDPPARRPVVPEGDVRVCSHFCTRGGLPAYLQVARVSRPCVGGRRMRQREPR